MIDAIGPSCEVVWPAEPWALQRQGRQQGDTDWTLEKCTERPGALLAVVWVLLVWVLWAAGVAMARGGRCGAVRAVERWGCRVPALRWLVEQRAPVGSRAELEQAVANGSNFSYV